MFSAGFCDPCVRFETGIPFGFGHGKGQELLAGCRAELAKGCTALGLPRAGFRLRSRKGVA